jgi:hypothetical protein
MGHAQPTTTMGYIGWSPTEGAAVVSKIVTADVTTRCHDGGRCVRPAEE